MKKIGMILSMSVGILTACTTHYASDREQRYLSSRNGPALAVPPTSTSELSHFYELPRQENNAKVNIVPPV